jgi:hypothetical protein
VVTAAVERAATVQARIDAAAALQASLEDLGYDIHGQFGSLLPAASGEPSSEFLVVGSPHSPDHGLRVRVGQDQLYVSVVRRAGTAAEDATPEDTRAEDADVQQRTCADLEDVARRALDRGVHLLLGNAQRPGRTAPQLAAEYWPAAATVDLAAQERREAAAMAEQARVEQRRVEQRRARTMRPGR